jgi:hypothetical protein
MRTTRKRKRISSVAELREEEGAGRRARGNCRNRLRPAAVREAPAVEEARAAAPASVVVQPLAERPVDSAVAGHPPALAAPRSAQPRLERALQAGQAQVGQRLPRDPLEAAPAVARRRPRKALRGPQAGRSQERESLPVPARQVALEPRKRPESRAARRLEPGKVGPGRPERRSPPGPGGPPSRADAAGEARRQGQGVARESRIFLPRAQCHERGYSRVAALFLTDPCEEYAGERRTRGTLA